MKRFLVVFILSAGLLFANEYENVAKNFITYQNAKVSIKSFEILKYKGSEIGYLFNLKERGYIIVPISKTISPIKAFSFDRNYNELPPNYKTFLLNQLYNAYKNRTLSKSIDSTISNRWNFLENYKPVLHRELYAPNKILLTTTWNQYYPYNKYLPKVGDKNVVAGCVQVAVAQVMKYWNYPKIAKGVLSRDIPLYSGSNYIKTDHLKAYLHRYYDWSLMPNDAVNAKEYAKESVARLMSDLLVVNNVSSAGTALTSADINMQALVENFGYSNSIKRVSNSVADIKSIIHNQIDNNQPVIISFPTHMAVADGYKDDDSGNFVHINLGWGGYANDYFDIDQDNSAGGYNLSASDINIVYNIKPCSQEAGDCYKNLESGDKIDGLDIEGVFDSQNDIDKYKLFLSGDTTLQGNRGYSNQAFYITLYNSKNELVTQSDNPINKNLPADLYTVVISLEGSNYSYVYDADYAQYSVKITTGSLSESEKNSILQNISTMLYMQDIKDRAISSSDIIPIYAYDTNSDNNLTFSAIANNNDVTVSMQDNILHITPNIDKGYSKIKVALHSGNDTIYKTFSILISNPPLYFGKNFSINGKFLNNVDIYKTKVILEGSCSISGNRGYTNQAFYAKVEDINGNATSFSDSAFNVSNLDLGFYYIDVSLNNGSVYYSYDEAHSDYIIKVSCPDAEENLTKIANLAGIAINNTPFPDETNSSQEQNTTNETNSTLNIQNLTLLSGWNLVSFEGNISSINDIKIAWQYHNGQWKVYAPSYNVNGYDILDDNISSIYGTWVKVDKNTTINITDSSILSPQYIDMLPGGWHLKGTRQDISIDNITCQNGTPFSIWKYQNGNWKLHTDIQNSLGLEDFTTINTNEGYWVKCP